MNIANCNFGCDIDGTITDGYFLIDNLTHDQVKDIIRAAPLKKGTEILSKIGTNTTFITGRSELYREETIEYFNTHSIPFKKIVMIDGYEGNKFDPQKYLSFKIKAYLDNNIRFALDDDPAVIHALIKHGIKARQVDGDFREAYNALLDTDK